MTERLAELAGTSVNALAGRLDLPREGGREQPAPRARPVSATGGTSPVREAIAILLYRPSLAREVGELPFQEPPDVPGVSLLMELLELLQRKPLASTGAILEHWRGRDEARHMAKLAHWMPVSEELDLLPDLRHHLQRIYRQHIEQKIALLNKKEEKQPLSEDERREYWKLQTLLQEVR